MSIGKEQLLGMMWARGFSEDVANELAEAIYRAMIAAAPQQEGVAGWRPMEDAPKDGTPILGCWLLPDRAPLFGVVEWGVSDEYGAGDDWKTRRR